MMVTTELNVFYEYNGVLLPSPSPDMTPSMVKDFYATMYPDLLNAQIGAGQQVGDQFVYKFERSVGTKG